MVIYRARILLLFFKLAFYKDTKDFKLTGNKLKNNN